jgi:hypothetical protein
MRHASWATQEDKSATLNEFHKALADGALDKARRIAVANPTLHLDKKLAAHKRKFALDNLQNKKGGMVS